MKHVRQGMVRARDGQSLVEYALILFLVALGAIAGLTAFGTELVKVYNSILLMFPAV